LTPAFIYRCADYVKNRTGILPSTKPLLYSSIVFGGFVFNGTLPLLFELAMECIYPVGGGIAGGTAIKAVNVVLLFFDIAFMPARHQISHRTSHP